jgi:hypothetical protein
MFLRFTRGGAGTAEVEELIGDSKKPERSRKRGSGAPSSSRERRPRCAERHPDGAEDETARELLAGLAELIG